MLDCGIDAQLPDEANYRKILGLWSMMTDYPFISVIIMLWMHGEIIHLLSRL